MRYFVKVIPRAKKDKVERVGAELKVHLTAPPVDGQANAALIAVLAEHFRVKKKMVRLLSGESSRRKIIEIDAGIHYK